MKETIYKVLPFDPAKASSKCLCIVLSVEGKGIIPEQISSDDPSFYGVGICKTKRFNYGTFFVITIDGIVLTFKSDGSSESSPLVLKIAEVSTQIKDGTKHEEDVTRGVATASDSWNILDDISVKVLEGLLSHIEQPYALGNDEMYYYCQSAYKWATNMLMARNHIMTNEENITK